MYLLGNENQLHVHVSIKQVVESFAGDIVTIFSSCSVLLGHGVAFGLFLIYIFLVLGSEGGSEGKKSEVV